MALHPVKLPKSAAYLFGIVALQKKLLKALAVPSLDADAVNTAWVQNVWSRLDSEWVRRFCLGGQEARIQAIAQGTPVARQALYAEFCRQNKVAGVLNGGGNFQDLKELPDFDRALVNHVKDFFKQCYKLLSHKNSEKLSEKWPGYLLPGNRAITNCGYKDDFCSGYPTKMVCPYCDCEIGTPELDHYLFKSGFPLLACSPWNIIPVCHSCNSIAAKGSRPAISPGPPRSTADWLHPFFRPASKEKVQIKLSGTPENSIPQLHSTDPAEQIRLDNHTELIRTLGKRWTKIAAVQFDVLVGEVSRRKKSNPGYSMEKHVGMRLEDYLEERGKAASAMVHAAVCRAVLEGRPEYIDEFITPNVPALE